jgi:type I restriction enzyme R subunit
VRGLVGLDREAAKQAFDAFLNGKTLTANQIQFVNLIIDYLTQSGWMRAAQLYESPFTDFSSKGVEGLFNPDEVSQIVTVLDRIKQNAVM